MFTRLVNSWTSLVRPVEFNRDFSHLVRRIMIKVPLMKRKKCSPDFSRGGDTKGVKLSFSHISIMFKLVYVIMDPNYSWLLSSI